MSPFDRQVRAQIYRLLKGGASVVDERVIAESRGWDTPEVEVSLQRLATEHRIVLVPDTTQIWMAHPFSGVETKYRSVMGDRSWSANCAWDALAILALLGDGRVEAAGAVGEVTWTVADGEVSPAGVVHFLVPARSFWDDVGFT